MQQHNFLQGSQEWLAHRGTCFNASDAPAMMSCSPYVTRSQLLHQLHTGLAPEADGATQRRFDEGHRAEALARPVAEQIIGDDLAPVVGSVGAGLARPLGASFDGITMLGDTLFEHKSLNDELRALPWDQGNGYHLPKQYQVQMEQQLLVSGAERVLFMASKWDGDKLVEERHCWYASDPKLRADVLAGWKQFEQDLAVYVPTQTAPAPIAKITQALPVVFDMRVEGKLVSCNLEQYKPAALAYIAAINTNLTNDQEFVDATVDAKYCRESASKLKLAIEQALGQMGDINTAITTVREVAAAFDAKGRELENSVKEQKDAIKEAQVERGRKALAEHVAALNEQIGKPYMPKIAEDFGGKIKGLRTVDSVRNAIDSELARTKIAANEAAGTIQTNMRALRELALDHVFLFADVTTIVLKAPDDCRALIENRIATHKLAEEKKEAEQREKIRLEEVEKLRREQEAEDNLVASIWANARRIEFDSVAYIQKAISYFNQAADFTNDPRPRVAAAYTEARAEMQTKLEAARKREADEAQARQAAEAAKPAPSPAPAPIASPAVAPIAPAANSPAAGYLPLTTAQAPSPSPAANVVPMQRTAAPTTPPTMKLGDINTRLQHFATTEAGLAALGFPATKVKGACLYHEADWSRMLDSIVAHARMLQQRELEAA